MDQMLIWGLGVASLLDWKFRKIPNWLTFSLTVIGLSYQLLSAGTHGLMQGALGLIVGVALLCLPFMLGGTGGGDVKLMGAIGAFVGPQVIVKVFLATAIIGGLFSLLVIVRNKKWKETLTGLKNRIVYAAFHRKLAPESKVTFTKTPIRIPYAIMISFGYLFIYFFGGY